MIACCPGERFSTFLPNSGSPVAPVRWIGVPLVSVSRLIATYTRPVNGAECAAAGKEISKRGPSWDSALCAHAEAEMSKPAAAKALAQRARVGNGRRGVLRIRKSGLGLIAAQPATVPGCIRSRKKLGRPPILHVETGPHTALR